MYTRALIYARTQVDAANAKILKERKRLRMIKR